MSLINSIIPSLNRDVARQDHSDGRSSATPAVKPVYEVKEADDAYSVTAYLPGVTKDAVEITAEAGELRILGRRTWKQPQGWTALYRESTNAPFELVLSHDNAIDAGKIAAELRDGVLRISLPKSEAFKPRKIAIN